MICHTVFPQNLCKSFWVQGSNLWITRTEPAEPVLQGPVQGSAIYLNRTVSPVQGSGQVSFALDKTGPRHHYSGDFMHYWLKQSIDMKGKNAEAAWKALVPPNGGFVYLGKDQRKYGISMSFNVI